MAERERLDVALVRRGLLPSRERAAAAIRAGLVRVTGRTAIKPSAPVGADDRIEVLADPVGYVSRGALKLKAALDAWGLDPAGRVCLDAGASTGGFTQLLLERGARLVYAVDVGRDQLHPVLRSDPRVVVMEGTDVRSLGALPGDRPDLAVADVSFISLTLVLPHLLRLASGAELAVLVKPQYELGPGVVNRRGVVRDPALHARAVARVVAAAAELRLAPVAPPAPIALAPGGGPPGRPAGPALPSPVPGGEGNREFWLLLRPAPPGSSRMD